MRSNLDTFRRYLEFEKRYSPHTVEAYLSDVSGFLSFCEEVYETTDASDIRHTQVRSWMVHMLENGIVPKSVNRKLSSLRSFFRLMRKLGILDTNPLAKVQAPRSGKSLPNVVEEKSLVTARHMVDEAAEFPVYRDVAVIEILYGLGLRQAELLSLQVGDIDMTKMQVRVTGKRKKQRLVPFGPPLKQFLEAYLRIRESVATKGTGSLILTDRGVSAYPKLIYRIVNRYLSGVSTVAKRSPHVLRHSYATHMLEAGAGIEAIKELLGHASLAATQVYTHTSVERLKKTYRSAHPKA